MEEPNKDGKPEFVIGSERASTLKVLFNATL